MNTSLDSAEPSDASIAHEIKSGNPAGLEKLYDRYSVLTFSVACRILGDQRLAEEAVQDAFHTVWRSASRYDQRRGGIRSWLMTILRNHCFDALRRQAARPKLSGVSEVADLPSPHSLESEAEQVQLGEGVRAAVRQLTPEQREAIELAYYGGLSQSEISHRLNIPLGTVKGRIRLAMQRLRTAIPIQEIVGAGE